MRSPLVLPLLLLLNAARALAAEPIVGVIIPGSEQEKQTFASSLAAELHDVQVKLIIERIALLPQSLTQQIQLVDATRARLGAIAVYWFDTSVPDRVFIYVAEPGGGRLQVRTITANTELERVEATAVVIRAMVRALLTKGKVEIDLPQDVPDAPPPSQSSAGFSLAAAYTLMTFGSAAPTIDGAEARAIVSLNAQWAVFAGYRLLLPASVIKPSGALTIVPHPIELGVRFLATFNKWRIGASASGTVDLLTRRFAASTLEWTPTPETMQVMGLGAVLFHLDWSPRAGVRAFVNAGPEVAFNTLQLVADVDGTRETYFSTWRVRVRLAAGISADFF